MNSSLPVIFWCLFIASGAFARIGDTPEQLTEKFGEPTASSFDQKNYGIALYGAPGFRQIRVTFAAGVSCEEVYFPADENAPHEPILAALEKENPSHEAIDGHSLGIHIGEREADAELKFVTHSGEQKSFTGILELKQLKAKRCASVNAGEAVVDIEFGDMEAEFANLRTGMKCTVTTLDEGSDDLYAPSAIVGRRGHVDWGDCVDDAHDSFQRLIKIVRGDEVLFGREVCGVHRQRMDLRSVPIAYGMGAYRPTEYCEKHFPHARDLAVGGCVMSDDSPEFVTLYLCPACVAACNEYKQAPPSEDK